MVLILLRSVPSNAALQPNGFLAFTHLEPGQYDDFLEAFLGTYYVVLHHRARKAQEDCNGWFLKRPVQKVWTRSGQVSTQCSRQVCLPVPEILELKALCDSGTFF